MINPTNKTRLSLAVFVTWIGVLAVIPNAAIGKNCREYRIDQSINAQTLWQDVSVLSSDEMQGRKSQTAGAHLAREYIQQRFKQIGLVTFSSKTSDSAEYLMPFRYKKSFRDIKGINVVGYLPGSEQTNQFIVITAHYDHLGKQGSTIYNGADDNASGVAAMLSIASAVKTVPTRNSIIFLATDAEEQGLYGAKAFVQDPPVKLSQIIFNLNLDMLSQGGRRNRLYVSGVKSNDKLQSVVAKSIENAGLCLHNWHRSSRRGYAGSSRMNLRGASDHAAFSRAKIPFLFIGVSDHNYYHTKDDTIEHLDPEFHTAATETSLYILRLMDNLN